MKIAEMLKFPRKEKGKEGRREKELDGQGKEGKERRRERIGAVNRERRRKCGRRNQDKKRKCLTCYQEGKYFIEPCLEVSFLE